MNQLTEDDDKHRLGWFGGVSQWGRLVLCHRDNIMRGHTTWIESAPWPWASVIHGQWSCVRTSSMKRPYELLRSEWTVELTSGNACEYWVTVVYWVQELESASEAHGVAKNDEHSLSAAEPLNVIWRSRWCTSSCWRRRWGKQRSLRI